MSSLKIGVTSDGKYGERAYANIKTVFETEWILVPEIPSNLILDDEVELNFPNCDLYVSYVRHPDIIIQIAELKKPLILGVLPGDGLLTQLKRVNPDVVHAQTMCSLESNTGIPEVDEFTKLFGRPIYDLTINPELFIEEIKVKRSSLCGSSDAGAKFLLNKKLNIENLHNFALSICHECRAPRFGRTCDKEVAGIIHLISLFQSPDLEKLSQKNNELKAFFEDMKKEYYRRKGK